MEFRSTAELRAESGRMVTGLAAPFRRPEYVRTASGEYVTEQFVEDSLEPLFGAPLHVGHPVADRFHDERDMPVSGRGEFAPDPTGLYGRWKVARTPAGDRLLEDIGQKRVTGLSVGFVPNPDADEWSADRQSVTRHDGLMWHVAAVPPGQVAQFHDARILEVRASSVSAARRRELAAKGQALPDGSYPIPDRAHLLSAARLAASGHGDVEAARRLIRKRARELGVDVSTLPGFGQAEGRHAALMTRQLAWLMAERYDQDEAAFRGWRGAGPGEAGRLLEARFR
jgi:HK97 family phage prohead protease